MDEAALAIETAPGARERPLVRAAEFKKSYRNRSAVRGVNLTIERGELYGLIGPDGAGKSSLMKAVAGVLTFDSGSLEVFGIPIESDKAAELIKDRIGFMPQGLGLNLYPELSIEENIDFFARLRAVDERALKERKSHLLSITRLEKFRSRPMKQLSGGMKQKLALACTLIHEPELIILDEPTTGVDPVSRRDFWAILSKLQQERGVTALVSTAYMDEASRFHRVSLLFEGSILAEGEPDRLGDLAPGYEVQLEAEPQIEALRLLKCGFSQVESLGGRLHVFVEKPDRESAEKAVRDELRTVDIHELFICEPDLEDVFIALLRRRKVFARECEEPATAAPFYERANNGFKAIEARELTRDFGPFRAVDKVSFSVAQGEIFGLLGANGAGKTTVIKMLTGILSPSAGSGHVAGADMRRAGNALKKRIGYVSQAFSLYQDLRVIDNIKLFAGIYGLRGTQARERMDWVLDMGGLRAYETDRTGSLPMGLRQRLALGCALLHRPQVLFLDEPTSGVDPIGRRQLWDILFGLSRREGVAILVTTHYMSEAEHCDRLALMHSGRIVSDASPAELKSRMEAEAGRILEIEVDRPLRAAELLQGAGFREAALFGKHIHVLSRPGREEKPEIPELLSEEGIEIKSIQPRPLSMEDVFVYRITRLEQQERVPEKGRGR